ncbi:MAG: AtpZ/AtpI family protein [Flavobacteriales bacterium]
MSERKPQKGKGKKNKSDLAKFSDIAIKMAVIIFVGVWGGMKLEAYLGFEKPVLTLFTSLASVLLAIYIVIRDLK